MRFIDPQDVRAKAATDAIHSGDVEILRTLLQDHPELVAARIGNAKEARTLLHILTDWPGHYPHGLETAKVLLSAGADVKAPFVSDRHSETALHWAASCDDVQMIDALLDAGADIEAGAASSPKRRWPTRERSCSSKRPRGSSNAEPKSICRMPLR